MNKKERPELQNLIKSKTTKAEKFQNVVLRPIIKMQHVFVVSIFKNYLLQRKITFKDISTIEKNDKIKHILSKDIQIKNLLIGSIIGHFTSKELLYYVQFSSEFNKRIIQIIIQRLQNSVTEL